MGERNDLIERLRELPVKAGLAGSYRGDCLAAADLIATQSTTIATLSEALAEAEKKGAEAREVCEERDEDIAVLLDAIETLERSGTLLPGREAGRVAGIKAFLTLRRGQPAPPRDLSQGGQHG